ncbi:MAG: hypothetical protein JWN44_929 [Myxococcales bacterium]|nr:hypothetical protein [Myxococcales bacterium]
MPYNDERRLLRRAVALAALTWLPLAAVAGIERALGGGIEPLFKDLAVHARLLIAVPLLSVAEALSKRYREDVLRRLIEEEYVADRRSLERITQSCYRWLSSPAVWVLIIAAALSMGQAIFWGIISATGPVMGAKLERLPHGPGGIWYTWVALPVFYVLIARVLLRWAAWTATLFQIARLPLRMVATHPDSAGGIHFVTRPSAAMAVTALATSSVLAASWGTEIALGGASAHSFLEPFAVWVLVLLLVTFGPFLLLSPRLVQTKRTGRREYGKLATLYSRRFHQRWIEAPPDVTLLGSADIQSLADMGGSFRLIREMRIVPFGYEDILRVLIPTLLPMIPLALTAVPLSKLLSQLVRAVA